jgi:hypothetical protein
MKSRSQKQALVWGGLFILVGVMGLVEAYIDLGSWVWVVVLAAAGLGVFGLYFSDRSEEWPLIPGYALWAVAGLIALVTLNVLQDEAVAFYVLTAIALPFLVVYLRNRQQWWALIPAYVLLAVGLMIALIGAGILSDLLVPGYVMFAIAIPFFVVFARNPKQWWALIPGGVLTIIGISFFIAEAALQYIGPAVLIILGIWILMRQLRRKETETPELSEEKDDEPPVE